MLLNCGVGEDSSLQADSLSVGQGSPGRGYLTAILISAHSEAACGQSQCSLRAEKFITKQNPFLWQWRIEEYLQNKKVVLC